jgi:radical SAM protein with 4Fe4S-binding SPASM domain
MILSHIKNHLTEKNQYRGKIDSCEVGHILVVDVDGSFYPCTMLSQCGEYFKIGSIEDGIDPDRLEFLKSRIDCNCVYDSVCGGGCRWERFKSHGEKDMHTMVRPEHCRTLHSVYISAMEFLDKIDDYGRSFIDVLLMKFEVSQKLTFDYGQYGMGHKIVTDSINLMCN